MFCIKCGKELKEDAAFCIHCGQSVKIKASAGKKVSSGKKFPIGLIAGSILLCLVLVAGGLGLYFFVLNKESVPVNNTNDIKDIAEESLPEPEEEETTEDISGGDAGEEEAVFPTGQETAGVITGYTVETISNDYCFTNSYDNERYQVFCSFDKPIFQGWNSEIIAAINGKLDEMAQPYIDWLAQMEADGWSAPDLNPSPFGGDALDVTPGIEADAYQYFLSPYVLESVYWDEKYLSISWSVRHDYEGVLYPLDYYESLNFDLSTGKEISIYDLIDGDPREVIEARLEAEGIFDTAVYGDNIRKGWERYNVYDVCFTIDDSNIYVSIDSLALYFGNDGLIELCFPREKETESFVGQKTAGMITGYTVETISNDYCYTSAYDSRRYQVRRYFEKPIIQGMDEGLLATINGKIEELAQPYVERLAEMTSGSWAVNEDSELNRTPGMEDNVAAENEAAPYKLIHIYYDDRYLSICWERRGYNSEIGDMRTYDYECINYDLTTGKEVSIYDMVDGDPRAVIEEALMEIGVFDDEEWEHSNRQTWQNYNVYDVSFYFDADILYVQADILLEHYYFMFTPGELRFSREDYQYISPKDLYVLPTSNREYLTMEDLYGLTQEQCRIARNELYARHGRLFNDEELQAYFNYCSWYYGYLAPEDFDDSVLNEYEKANRDLIIQYEKEMGYR